MVGSTEQAVKISEQLRASGILVTAIRPPTVPDDTARLRVTFSAKHTTEDIVILLDALNKTLK
jgi:8-amino-7-oxononanoate synthase